jgi:hypothetical protein
MVRTCAGVTLLGFCSAFDAMLATRELVVSFRRLLTHSSSWPASAGLYVEPNILWGCHPIYALIFGGVKVSGSLFHVQQSALYQTVNPG